MIEDRVLVGLVMLAVLALAVGARMYKYGAYLGRPHLEGMGFFVGLFFWLGAVSHAVVSYITGIAWALSLPLLVWGWREIRSWIVGARVELRDLLKPEKVGA